MKRKVLVLAALVMAMAATTLKAQLNVGSTAAPITTLDVQGSSYIKNNLGVGISAPTAKMHIAADAAFNGGQFNISGISNTNKLLQLGFNTTTDKGYIQATIAGSTVNDLLINPAGGNVGIGTASPAAKLDIAGTIKVVDGSQGSGKVLTSDANGLASWATPTASTSTNLYNSDGTLTGSRTVTMANNSLNFTGGNVGVNTTSPQQKLEVNAASNPIRFSSLASITSTTNVLAIDALGDIRSIPVTSLATTAPSAGPQVTGPSANYAATGNESIIFAGSGVVLTAPTAAQIGHSITIIPSYGVGTSCSGSVPYANFSLQQIAIPHGQRITITGITSSRYASGTNVWAITAKDF